MKCQRIGFGAVLFFVLTAAGAVWGQAPPGPLHPNPNAEPEQVPTKELAKNAIKVRVNEVVAPVTVTDPKGEMILSLNKDQFHVFDNGVEQKIEHFDVGGDPLSIVLVFETSSHIEPMMPAVTGVSRTRHGAGHAAPRRPGMAGRRAQGRGPFQRWRLRRRWSSRAR